MTKLFFRNFFKKNSQNFKISKFQNFSKSENSQNQKIFRIFDFSLFQKNIFGNQKMKIFKKMFYFLNIDG